MTADDVIERFRACEGAILLFSLEGKAPVDLLHSNPLAGFCLAVNWLFHKPTVLAPLTAARALARKPQREILGWLAFRPQSEAIAKIGRKCVSESLSIERCLRFRRALAEPQVREMLAHLPRINAGVMGLVSSHELRPYLTTSLLASVAEKPTEDTSENTASVLRDLHEMRLLVRRGQTAPKFCTRRRIVEEHDALVLEVNQRGVFRFRRCTFPPPPIPELREDGTEIIPIRNTAALQALGREQHNCVASYARRILNGSVYIYRVEVQGETSTLSIARNRSGFWQVEELKAACNRRAGSQTEQSVRRWLFPVRMQRSLQTARQSAGLLLQQELPLSLGR